ncbi:MAG: GNAT family N-acetyltransferase [Anaerolineae bacterium]|nr:GNAT family N-acetyltransferase [Anaerolineae bacterium]
MESIFIEPAVDSDLDVVLDLLRRSNLPVDGLADHFGGAIVARQDGRVVGCAAVEMYEDGGLLRSVAVDDSLRGLGFGQQLTNAALDLARDRQMPAVYLLTTTAADFFGRFYGFQTITRDDVPESVRQSVEFQSACPASAVVMVLVL